MSDPVSSDSVDGQQATIKQKAKKKLNVINHDWRPMIKTVLHQYIHQLSLFRRKLGLFHEGSLSFSPKWAVLLSYLIFLLMALVSADMLYTVNTPIGVTTTLLATNALPNIYSKRQTHLAPFEFEFGFMIWNETFPDDICDKLI